MATHKNRTSSLHFNGTDERAISRRTADQDTPGFVYICLSCRLSIFLSLTV